MAPLGLKKEVSSENLETTVHPSGKRQLWKVKDQIAKNQEVVRSKIALWSTLAYLMVTIVLLFCKKWIEVDPAMYYGFGTLMGAIIGFYFNPSRH